MRQRTWFAIGITLALALTLIAPLTQSTARAQATESRVRFLHAVPGAPAVDVYLDGALAVTGLAFGEVTPHLRVAGGDHQVALRVSGAAADAIPLIEVAVPLVPSLAFVVVVQGAPDALQAALYEDVLDPIDPGLARMTAINAIADAPPLDLLTSEGGPLLQGVTYGVQFGTVNIGAGARNLVMVPAGGAVESAILSFGDVSLVSGMLYTFVALGTLEGDTAPSGLVLVTPINGTENSVSVRVAHASPDAPAVDVYANDTLLVPNLALGQMTGHIALPAGTYTLAVRPAGSPAADAPVATSEVTLDPSTPAVTVAAIGEVGAGTLSLQVFADLVAGIKPEQARLAVINGVPGATVDVTLTDESGTALASALGTGTQSSTVDVPAGEFMILVGIKGVDTPVDLVVPAETYYGGVYYSVLVFGGGAAAVPFDARVAGTEINVTVASLPKAAPPMAAAVEQPTPQPEATQPPAEEAQPAEGQVESAPPAETPAETPSETGSEVVQPAETPAPGTDTELVQVPEQGAAEAAAQPTQTPMVPTVAAPVAYVELNPGANLHCRELPGADKKSLGLIPSGSTLTVLGRTGEPLVPETGEVTPEPTPVVETIEDLWLSVRWDPPSGGYLRCWVAAQFLRVEWKGRLLDDLEELWELPEVPFNQPGEAVGTDITPPTPLFDAVIATVELQPGVSLQLRRFPKTDAESLALVPALAQLEVLGYAEAPSEGLVGQPTNPYWLYVRYRQEDGSATVGWVSAQYVSLSKLGRPYEITDLVVVDVTEGGYFEAPGQRPAIPVEQQDVVGTVNLNPGANLNLRDRPSADGRVVVGIPSGESMVINGRNGDGTWVQVTYTSPTGKLDGWVASQYLIITRGGQPYEIRNLPIVTGEEDLMGG
ncbi:MAG: hypothetical protein KatS3mg051_0089 [Anaerolineae bacterium]|nr:MAG: hypothetical protein KatS3mg051_0089 [Anaerolineae bacterium]